MNVIVQVKDSKVKPFLCSPPSTCNCDPPDLPAPSSLRLLADTTPFCRSTMAMRRSSNRPPKASHPVRSASLARWVFESPTDPTALLCLSGYEVVDVDGLIFRRKRKAEPQSPQRSKRAKTPAGSPRDTPGTRPSTPGVGALEDAVQKSHADAPPGEPALPAGEPQMADGVEGVGEGVEEAQDGDAAAEPHASPAAAERSDALLSALPQAASEAERLLCLCDELAKVGY